MIFIKNKNYQKPLLEQFTKLKRHNRQGSYKTRERYAMAFQRFIFFLATVFHLQKLANIHAKHVTAYVEDMKNRDLSASTIKTDLAAIRFWHDQIPQAKYVIPDNGKLDLERRSFGRVDRTWSEEEFRKVITYYFNHYDNDDHEIIALAKYTGLRIHEVFRLDTACAKQALKTGYLTVKGKGGKLREVPLNDSSRSVLTHMLNHTVVGQKLFVSKGEQTHLVINQFQKKLNFVIKKVYGEDLEKSLTFHGLRHTWAVEQYRVLRETHSHDETCKQISVWLGHERKEVTRIYLASLSEEKLND